MSGKVEKQGNKSSRVWSTKVIQRIIIGTIFFVIGLLSRLG